MRLRCAVEAWLALGSEVITRRSEIAFGDGQALVAGDAARSSFEPTTRCSERFLQL